MVGINKVDAHMNAERTFNRVTVKRLFTRLSVEIESDLPESIIKMLKIFRNIAINRILVTGTIPRHYLTVTGTSRTQFFLKKAIRGWEPRHGITALRDYIGSCQLSGSGPVRINTSASWRQPPLSGEGSFPWEPSVNITRAQLVWILKNKYMRPAELSNYFKNKKAVNDDE